MMADQHATAPYRDANVNLYSVEIESELYRFDRLREAESWRLASRARAAQGNGYESKNHRSIDVLATAAARVSATVRSWYSRPEPQCC